jgi:hypothetical protein
MSVGRLSPEHPYVVPLRASGLQTQSFSSYTLQSRTQVYWSQAKEGPIDV